MILTVPPTVGSGVCRKLVRKYGDSCKSVFIFTIFIIVLSSFLFFMEPPPNALASVNAAAVDALEYILIFG